MRVAIVGEYFIPELQVDGKHSDVVVLDIVGRKIARGIGGNAKNIVGHRGIRLIV
jgi:hypothetical protein